MRDSDVIALAVADIHLSLNPPIARSGEDWLAAQERQLNELHSLAEEHKCPILVAGDVFNRASDSPYFINWVIDHIPKFWYCVPGNHDLLYHSYADIQHTSYWTLVKAGKIVNIEPNKPIDYYVKTWPVRFWGFPCGYPVKPCPSPKDMILEIAVAHQYIWTLDTGYEGAREEDRLKHLWKKIKGFDVVVSGDNHKHFYNRGSRLNQSVWNCGTFFRRKISERDCWPSIGLIHADGTVTSHQMDISMDKFIPLDNTQVEAVEGMDDLIKELEEKNIDAAIDFRENINKVMESKGVSQKIKNIIMEAFPNDD